MKLQSATMGVVTRRGESKPKVFYNIPRDVKKLFIEEVVANIKARR
jgi:hypothetical protein